MLSKENFFVDKIRFNAIGSNADLLIYHPQGVVWGQPILSHPGGVGRSDGTGEAGL